MSRVAAWPRLPAEPGIDHYFKEIVLDPQEEYMLAKRWREGGDRDAAHQLITSHLAARRQDRQGLSRLWFADR